MLNEAIRFEEIVIFIITIKTVIIMIMIIIIIIIRLRKIICFLFRGNDISKVLKQNW